MSGVVIGGTFTRSAPSDTYPTHDANLELGGLHSAATHTDRDAIPAECRYEGMQCYTANDSKTWQLQGGVANGNWVDVTSGGTPPAPSITVTLGDTFATNQAFKLVSGLAQPIYSTDSDPPYVDGLTLESGIASAVVVAAMLNGNRYMTPLALPAGTPLYLGQDGKPTATQPSLIAGDVWYVSTMRQDDSTHFMFAPTEPIKL